MMDRKASFTWASSQPISTASSSASSAYWRSSSMFSCITFSFSVQEITLPSGLRQGFCGEP